MGSPGLASALPPTIGLLPPLHPDHHSSARVPTLTCPSCNHAYRLHRPDNGAGLLVCADGELPWEEKEGAAETCGAQGRESTTQPWPAGVKRGICSNKPFYGQESTQVGREEASHAGVGWLGGGTE